MKCYVELPCNNVELISEEIYQFVENNTDILSTTKYGWHFIDCKNLLINAPLLFEYFKINKLIPRHAAITIVTESNHLPRHIDELPVVAKINFPVRNTVGWVNRWFDGDSIIAELFDMNLPIVFNSQIAHSVDKIIETDSPRLVASFTFHKEPIEWLK
jgi:hypothetical protein